LRLADGMIVSDPRVFVADGNGKKFDVSLGRFRADIGDERWNLERFVLRGDNLLSGLPQMERVGKNDVSRDVVWMIVRKVNGWIDLKLIV
jgi:hypothetical protein